MAHEAQADRDTRLHVLGDRIILGTLCGAAVASIAIGQYFGETASAVVGASVLVGLALIGYALARGTLASRMLLGLCLSGMAALQIQVGHGTLEFHFGVFVTLALLLVYRDWRPILASAVFFAVQHLLADRLQALGYGVYCAPEANLLKILMHAAYLVVQTGLEIVMAIWMSRLGAVCSELEALVRSIDQDSAVCLDVAACPVTTPQARALQQVVGRMEQALLQVRSAALEINTASDEIATGTLDLSNRTEQTATHLQHAATSMDKLTGAVRQTADSAHQANTLATAAASVAAKGGATVALVVSTMGEIDASSKTIVDIISVIDSIAFQTNILALNAAVEAARAGEQGRGFAVVASEVRGLAKRSADAAKDIKSLIKASEGCVAQGAQLVTQAGGNMSEIVGSVQNVAHIIEAITTASRDQAHELSVINATVLDVEKMTQQNAALVEQSSAASETLHAHANLLNDMLRGFRLSAGPRLG